MFPIVHHGASDLLHLFHQSYSSFLTPCSISVEHFSVMGAEHPERLKCGLIISLGNDNTKLSH